jgi:prepilin-type N-terminal cleavage/methylation domain-containing protein
MKKRAYTMIELVMVIVVLGIVASIGAEIIAKLYENYIRTRAINKLQAQTELVLDQISKRLTYRIRGSVRAVNETNSSFVALSSGTDLSNYQVLEWIGKDNEGFRGDWNGSTTVPGWSGFVDLDSNETDKNISNIAQLKTSGSELNVTDTIVRALSDNRVSLDIMINPNRPVLIFKGSSDYNVSKYYTIDSGGASSYAHEVYYNLTGTNHNEILHFVNYPPPNEIYEQYNLAWSAYSIVPDSNSSDFNLTLHYNYQPWVGDDYNSTTTRTSVLAEHVSTFRFTQVGETIRVKLCIKDTTTGYDFAFCKERAIF